MSAVSVTEPVAFGSFFSEVVKHMRKRGASAATVDCAFATGAGAPEHDAAAHAFLPPLEHATSPHDACGGGSCAGAVAIAVGTGVALAIGLAVTLGAGVVPGAALGTSYAATGTADRSASRAHASALTPSAAAIATSQRSRSITPLSPTLHLPDLLIFCAIPLLLPREHLPDARPEH